MVCWLHTWIKTGVCHTQAYIIASLGQTCTAPNKHFASSAINRINHHSQKYILHIHFLTRTALFTNRGHHDLLHTIQWSKSGGTQTMGKAMIKGHQIIAEDENTCEHCLKTGKNYLPMKAISPHIAKDEHTFDHCWRTRKTLSIHGSGINTSHHITKHEVPFDHCVRLVNITGAQKNWHQHNTKNGHTWITVEELGRTTYIQ